MEKVQHPYECVAKGHAGGSRTFFAAPPDWFEARGMTTPRNCQDCRAWVKAQVDEMKTCNCGSKIRLSANSKISYFKKDGPYVPPEECRPCREGNRPPKGTKKRPDRKEKEEKEKEKRSDDFRMLHHGISPQPRAIMKDGAYYRDKIPGKDETRIEHLEHHIPGSAHDLTTSARAAQGGLKLPKSPSSFASGSGFEGLLANTQTFLNSADSNQVREYASGVRIVRVTFTGDHDRLEITLLDKLPGDTYGVATTYDNVTTSDVKGQPWYN